MPLFSRRTHHTTHRTTPRRRHFWHRADKDRVAGGYKAALSNPRTTRDGRKHAKHELRKMGRSPHVPFMTKVKRTLGIRSTPRRHHHHTTARY
ncbi:hypothetical protein E1B28_004268 [Marasmius oreades]|uniref:Uncharacterized protein n=1 Tax=Marasmius oreades TaxID=181124 RepID=A0A9P7UYD1_9AGAR|nr:uncharacterized protein E1B28_004268 [Marasmius oreades]KAG7096860.1 hypothetical protein E1B28_004268 [Marasmius oreades]